MSVQSFFEEIVKRLSPAESMAGLTINILLTLVIVAVGLSLARAAKQRTVRVIGRSKMSGNLAVLFGNITFIGVIVLAVLLTLRLYGLDATALIAVLGVSTVAIGLALQDLLKNLFAGVYLLLEQPFRIGDTIVVDNREGEVESIEVRTTVLRMRDGTQALVPNAVVLATTVMNRTAYPTRRVGVRISGLGEDLETIAGRVTAALAGQPGVADKPSPRVHIESVSEGKATAIVDIWRPADRDLPPTVLLALQAAFPEASVALQQ